jgi:hypothetical protein
MIGKYIVSVIVLAFLLGTSVMPGVAKGASDSLEEDLFDMGFEPVLAAIETCETHFGRKIVIPYKLPTIPFHYFLGRCGTSYGINNQFQVDFINEDVAVYSIRMRPIEQRIDFSKNERARKYNLNDGSTASYIEIRPGKPYFLVFDKKDWQYTLQVNSKEPNIVTPEQLVEIADSIGSNRN